MRLAALIGAMLALTCGVATASARVKTFKNPKGTITVKAGQRFNIALESTPGTGYSWQVTKRPNPHIVKYLGSKTGPSSAPGAPAEQVLRFKAVDPGTTSMVLAYVGPGRDHPVGKRLSVNVKVK
jgi:predicted secreted protein